MLYGKCSKNIEQNTSTISIFPQQNDVFHHLICEQCIRFIEDKGVIIILLTRERNHPIEKRSKRNRILRAQSIQMMGSFRNPTIAKANIVKLK